MCFGHEIQSKHTKFMKKKKKITRAMEEQTSKSTTINDLPDDILIHTLSFLPTTHDAITTTTLLSPRWRNLWCSLPSLRFISHTFPRSTSPSITLRNFALFVSQTLNFRKKNYPSSDQLLEFRLVFHADKSYADIVHFWVCLAMTFDVVHLDLELCKAWNLANHSYDDEHDERNEDDSDDGDVDVDVDDERYNYYPDIELWYSFNFSMLSYKNVMDLKLRDCQISLPPNMLECKQRFCSLRTLSFFHVYVTDEMIPEIILGCVNLEEMVLAQCRELHAVKIQSSKLKKLSLKHYMGGYGSIEINAPNLVSLILTFFEVGKYIFKDVSSLVEARITCRHYCYWSTIVRLLGHVRRLTVQNCWFKLLLSGNAPPESFVLHNLKYLELRTGYSKLELFGMAALLERCPNLDTMILDYITDLYEEESLSEEFLNKQITLSIPSLRRVELKCYKKTQNELLLVELLKEQGVENILLYNTEVGENRENCVNRVITCLPKRKRLDGEIDYFLDDNSF